MLAQKKDADDEGTHTALMMDDCVNVEANNTIKLKKNILSTCCKYFWIFTLTTILVLFTTVYIVIPLIFMNVVDFQRLLMFTNIGLPHDKESYETNLIGIRNLYATVQDDEKNKSISLGVWHVLPEELAYDSLNKSFSYDDALANSNYSVLIYFHGSGETRRDNAKTYLILRTNFHILAFDYRDYGDSTSALLSENAVANDSIQLYNWVRNKTKADIFIWAHSLGTALSTNTISKLKELQVIPAGLILEAPFTTMMEEIPVHPFGKIFSWLPWFKITIINPLEDNGFRFNNSKYIVNVDCPVLILHAEDDSIIPYTLGKKLYEIGSLNRNASLGRIMYHQIPGKYGCDHFSIYKYPELNNNVEKFLEVCKKYKRKSN